MAEQHAETATPETSNAEALGDLGITTSDGPEAEDFVALLEGISDGSIPTANDTEEASEEVSEETTEAKPEEETETVEVDLFSEKALSTKAGILAAKQKVKELDLEIQKKQRKLDGFDIKLGKKQKAWEAKKTQELESLRSDRQIARQLKHTIEVIQNGTAEDVLVALGNITGKSGRQVYEDMIRTVMSDGKRSAPNPEVQTLKSKLAELEAHIHQQRQDAEEAQGHAVRQQTASGIQHMQGEIVGMAAENPEVFPVLASRIEAGQGDLIAHHATRFIVASNKRGQRVSYQDALAALETQLAQKFKAGSAGQVTPKKKPGQQSTQSQSARKAASGLPVSSRSMPSPRELTEDERDAELARDPELLSNLFG